MSTLALDLGTSVGWARHAPGQPIEFGTHSVAGSGAHPGSPFQSMRNFLHAQQQRAIALGEPIHRIAFERPFGLKWKNANAGEMQIGLRATMLGWAAFNRIPVTPVTVEDLKRSFAGKAKADKAAMMARARELGHDVKTDHEADAIAVLYVTGALKG